MYRQNSYFIYIDRCHRCLPPGLSFYATQLFSELHYCHGANYLYDCFGKLCTGNSGIKKDSQ